MALGREKPNILQTLQTFGRLGRSFIKVTSEKNAKTQLYRGHKVPRNSGKSVLPQKKAIKLDMTPFVKSDFRAQKSVESLFETQKVRVAVYSKSIVMVCNG